MLVLDGGEEAIEKASGEVAGRDLFFSYEQLRLRALTVLHYSYGLIHRDLSNLALVKEI